MYNKEKRKIEKLNSEIIFDVLHRIVYNKVTRRDTDYGRDRDLKPISVVGPET